MTLGVSSKRSSRKSSRDKHLLKILLNLFGEFLLALYFDCPRSASTSITIDPLQASLRLNHSMLFRLISYRFSFYLTEASFQPSGTSDFKLSRSIRTSVYPKKLVDPVNNFDHQNKNKNALSENRTLALEIINQRSQPLSYVNLFEDKSKSNKPASTESLCF